MANGIIIIDKPAGWTSMDVCPSPQNDGAFFVGEHHIVDFARSGHFARSVGHISKGFHQGNHIVFFEVNVFDGVFEKVFLG